MTDYMPTPVDVKPTVPPEYKAIQYLPPYNCEAVSEFTGIPFSDHDTRGCGPDSMFVIGDDQDVAPGEYVIRDENTHELQVMSEITFNAYFTRA